MKHITAFAGGEAESLPLTDGKLLDAVVFGQYLAGGIDDALLVAIQDVMAKHEQQIVESNRLTDLIIGTKTVRGFLQRIEDEKEKYKDVLVEMKLVEPMYINTLVEAQLIGKRHDQMEKRKAELMKLNVASK